MLRAGDLPRPRQSDEPVQKAQELGRECEVEKHVPGGQGRDGAQSTPWSDQRGFCPHPEEEGHPGPGPVGKRWY